MTQEKFEIWAVIESLDHKKISGKICEHQIIGLNMVRIDVPDTKHKPAFTRYLNPLEIYAIDPVTEEEARSYAAKLGHEENMMKSFGNLSFDP